MAVPRLFLPRAFTSFVDCRAATPSPRRVFHDAWGHRAQRHPEAGTQHFRSLTTGTNHSPPRRQYTPEELLQNEKETEAVARGLLSSRGGEPWMSSRLFGGSRGHRIRDAILTSVCSIVVLLAGGVIYVDWYKEKVLRKIETAFSAGHNSAHDLTKHAGPTPWTQHVRRAEQDRIDRIVQGKEVGRYFILLGPKGTGKTTMIFDAMQTIQGDGVAVCDAHPDLEVFRLRLGKALNYDYDEDSQTGLFRRRDPREGGPTLDIERALNKLEIVALKHKTAKGKPLVLIINNVHLFNHDDSGRNILLQFQQRADAWAAMGILTMVFSSDDFWPCFFMRQNASRIRVVSVYDLSHKDSLTAAMNMRTNANRPGASPEMFEAVVSLIGGRLTYLGKVTKAGDMLNHAKYLLAVEKTWLLSQIGLIPNCDNSVVDEQKWSSSSWLLLKEFVKRRQEDVARMKEKIERGKAKPEDLDDLPLPRISYYEARQIMTRTDFIDELDRKNIIAIDINYDLTPDSVLILRAAEEVCAEEGFDELLEGVRRRVDENQFSHELTFKEIAQGDQIRLKVNKGGTRLMEG